MNYTQMKLRIMGIFAIIGAMFSWLVAINQGGTSKAMVIFAFWGNEEISICGNIDRMGYGSYIPEFLRSRFLQIREEKKNSGGNVK